MTLVELVVVVLLIGIAAAVAAPAVRRAAELDDVGRIAAELDGLLVSARRSAVERAVAVELVVAPESGRYWITAPGATSFATVEGVLSRPGGVTLSGPPRTRFTVQPDGAAAGDSLWIQGAGARAWVAFDPLTGDGRVVRP